MFNRAINKIKLKNTLRNFNRDYEGFDPNCFIKQKIKCLEDKTKLIRKENNSIINKLNIIINKLDN